MPAHRTLRVGELRPNQLLHTYGVGAVADLPNLSVVMRGLDSWDLTKSEIIEENRLLAAMRRILGNQVAALRLPPHMPASPNVFDEWARVGVPVGLFPTWLRCTRNNCNFLGPVSSGRFRLMRDSYRPERIKYVHENCTGRGRPPAVPARFVLACSRGHLDDFPWMYFVHRGSAGSPGCTLTMSEVGTTGTAAEVQIRCEGCGAVRAMPEAFGERASAELPACRGRHAHLGRFDGCGDSTRTLVLGATNSWFGMVQSGFTLPRADEPVAQAVAEHWNLLETFAELDEQVAERLLPTTRIWPELEQFGFDDVWRKMREHAAAPSTDDGAQQDVLDLKTPEWKTFISRQRHESPEFTTHPERVPAGAENWLSQVVLAPRLREVAALYGFTRLDSPEWDTNEIDTVRTAPLSAAPPTWVPCAEMRGEGIFLRFDEDRLVEWETLAATRSRETKLRAAHDKWRDQRRLEPGHWPGVRYVLLHTFAHVLMREFALECGYGAAGISERIYARSGGDVPMAGVLLYTAAPDSEGTLGGLVSLGARDRLGRLIDQALEAARLCSSDPLCAEHDPRIHGRLHGAACHACLFAAETSCERGNHYLDRAILVDTVLGNEFGFFPR